MQGSNSSDQNLYSMWLTPYPACKPAGVFSSSDPSSFWIPLSSFFGGVIALSATKGRVNNLLPMLEWEQFMSKLHRVLRKPLLSSCPYSLWCQALWLRSTVKQQRGKEAPIWTLTCAFSSSSSESLRGGYDKGVQGYRQLGFFLDIHPQFLQISDLWKQLVWDLIS